LTAKVNRFKDYEEEYLSDVNELLRIIGSILKTMKGNS